MIRWPCDGEEREILRYYISRFTSALLELITMLLESLCPPAVIYLAFSFTHVVIEMFRRNYNTAFIKFIVMVVFTILLDILCSRGLGVVSWFIVFIPFIMMTFMTSILALTFGTSVLYGESLDDTDYRLNYY